MGHGQISPIQLIYMTNSYPPCFCCLNHEYKVTPTLVSEFELIHCQGCGSAFTWPQLTPNELEKYYRQSYYGPENVKFISPLEWIVEWISEKRAHWLHHMIPSPSRILEIGCGRGLLLSALQKKGHECFGIERSNLAASRAKELGGLTISTESLQECSFAENSFDLAILWHSLEHLHDPRGTLIKLHDLLKPGGKIIIEVPNLDSLQSRWTGRNWFHLDIERHLFHFTPQGLGTLVSQCGFEHRVDGTFSIEQAPFGALQSFLNGLIPHPEALYRTLKNEISLPGHHLTAQLLSAMFLFLPTLFFVSLECLMGRGAVIRSVATKLDNHSQLLAGFRDSSQFAP